MASSTFSGSTTSSTSKISWLRAVVAALILGGIAFGVNHTVENALQDNLRQQLRTIRDADVAALELWLDTQRSVVDTIANSPRFQEQIATLVHKAREEQEALAARLARLEAAAGAEPRAARPRKSASEKRAAGKGGAAKKPAGKLGEAR